MTAEQDARPATAPFRPGRERWSLLFLPVSVLALLYHHADAFTDPLWVPIHDTLTQYTEFLYALASFRNGELPLWNSYWHGGQPFYLLLNHGLLLNPLHWVWMALGSALRLTTPQIYICAQVSGVILFALGGYFLARTLTRSIAGGVGAFMILLFSGTAGYWMTQVYSMHVIMYVPWVLLLVLRYVSRPSLGRALSAAVIIGISMNTYYPVYLFTFVVTLGVLLLIFYRRRLARLPFRAIAAHALAAVPLLMLLLLPTYLTYREITAGYYQIARDPGPAQQEPARDGPAFDLGRIGDAAATLVPSMVNPTRYYHAEGVPLVGAAAVVLALYEALAFRRRGRFWLAALLLMTLHVLGTATPFHDISQALIPFYRIIGATVFFTGFLVLCIAMLAALGIERALRIAFDGRFRVTPPVVRCAGGLVLAVMLTIGSYNTGTLLSGPIHTIRSDMFSYSDRFGFSDARPDFYAAAQPLGTEFSGECCVTFFHLAERFDAPYYFDRWQSLHTLFIPRDLYDTADFEQQGDEGVWRASAPGFEDLITRKFHWFSRYAVAAAAPNIGAWLDRQVLPVDDDGPVRARHLRIAAEALSALPAQPHRDQAPVTVTGKTANTLSVSVELPETRFLLYTDLYHPGFRAVVDGRERTVLKGMGVFKALELEPGRHTVSFIFAPRYRYVLIAYLLISIPALIALAGDAARRLLRK